jgi:hypothetical protein
MIGNASWGSSATPGSAKLRRAVAPVTDDRVAHGRYRDPPDDLGRELVRRIGRAVIALL